MADSFRAQLLALQSEAHDYYEHVLRPGWAPDFDDSEKASAYWKFLVSVVSGILALPVPPEPVPHLDLDKLDRAMSVAPEWLTPITRKELIPLLAELRDGRALSTACRRYKEFLDRGANPVLEENEPGGYELLNEVWSALAALPAPSTPEAAIPPLPLA